MLMSVTQSTAGTLVGNLCLIAMFPLLVSMHMQKGGYERGADFMLGLEMVFRGFTQAKSDSVKPFHAEFYRIIIKRAALRTESSIS
ncbi:Uncharacterised protein [Yersinia enterocolitica]|nr:Uncharacterised protein [Yersinia enterocolitica]